MQDTVAKALKNRLDIARQSRSLSETGDSDIKHIITLFDHITEPTLRALVFKDASFNTVIEHRGRLGISEELLIEKARYKPRRDDHAGEPHPEVEMVRRRGGLRRQAPYYLSTDLPAPILNQDGTQSLENLDWRLLIPHLDSLSLTREKAVEQCLKSTDKEMWKTLLLNHEKIGLTQKEAVDKLLEASAASGPSDKRLTALIECRKNLRGVFPTDAVLETILVAQKKVSVLHDNLGALDSLSAETFRFLAQHDPEVNNVIGDHFFRFKGLTKEDAYLLLKIPRQIMDLEEIAWTIGNNAKYFSGLDFNKEFALRMLEHYSGSLERGLHVYDGLDADIGVFFLFHGKDDVLDQHPHLTRLDTASEKTKRMWAFHEDKTIPRAIREADETVAVIGRLAATDDLPIDAEKILKARLTHGLSPEEYFEYASTQGGQELPPAHESGAEMILKEIERQQRAKDPAIADALEWGMQWFKPEIILAYMNRADLSRHDALHFMPHLIKLMHNTSGQTSEDFGRKILLEVARDNATYETGTAHHHLLGVIEALQNKTPEGIFIQLKEYGSIRELQNLVLELEGKNPFDSWKSLKKFKEIVTMLDRNEILDELNEGSIPEKTRRFIEPLAFHPNVSGEAVIKFWKRTAEFLEIDDEHTSDLLNDAKKPSNYLSLPYLGLEASDLFEALVNGEMDDIQKIPPFERIYHFGTPSKEETSSPELLHLALRRALGERSKNIKGTATNVSKLFKELQVWSRAKSVDWKKIWDEESGVAALNALAEIDREELRALLYHEHIGIRGIQEPLQTYRARIGLKSDPSMVVAGNDTASCMTFGSGKNNVYMFNPNCSQMVLERLNSDGAWRTAAQSVMTIDHETARKTPELVKEYLEQGTRLKDLVGEGDLERPNVLTCDNIEPAKNEEGNRAAYIAQAYQKFFTEYLDHFADTLKVDRSKVVAGTGYSPAELPFEKIENHFVPQAPMGYSDNTHEQCFVIKTGLEGPVPRFQKLAALTTRDALAVAALEGKAYDDNQEVIINLHNMQNRLIGMEIANRHFHRPNLSFMYRDDHDRPRGYILAYEGIAENGNGEKLGFVYIDDLASDKTSLTAGGRLITQFFTAYRQHYGSENQSPVPIIADARESTSYPIIKKNFAELAKQAGFKAKLIELSQKKTGGETFYKVAVLIAKNDHELAEQEQRYQALAIDDADSATNRAPRRSGSMYDDELDAPGPEHFHDDLDDPGM